MSFTELVSHILVRFPYYSEEDKRQRCKPDVTKAFVKYGISLTLDHELQDSLHNQRLHTFYYRARSWKTALFYATTIATFQFVGRFIFGVNREYLCTTNTVLASILENLICSE